jgi:hypothetical protein
MDWRVTRLGLRVGGPEPRGFVFLFTCKDFFFTSFRPRLLSRIPGWSPSANLLFRLRSANQERK